MYILVRVIALCLLCAAVRVQNQVCGVKLKMHYLLFSLKQLYMLIPGLSEALHKSSLALGQLFW